MKNNNLLKIKGLKLRWLRGYIVAWIVALSIAIFWGSIRSLEVLGNIPLLLFSIIIFILLMGLPLAVFFSIIITIIKYRRHWKKLVVIYFSIGLFLYLIASSILFVSFIQDYGYSVNCLKLLEGKPNNLKSHDYSGCSAYKESSGKQNYINYLTEKTERGIGGVLFQSFFGYTLLVIPLWPLGILYPIVFLFIPT